MGFFSENWLWRGTQSAIFYYVSCSPCIEYKYKRRRKHEAAQAEKYKAEIITTQPGQVRQPGAFQTNEGWVEEILMGPGPPKGWKRDPIAEKATTTDTLAPSTRPQHSEARTGSTSSGRHAASEHASPLAESSVLSQMSASDAVVSDTVVSSTASSAAAIQPARRNSETLSLSSSSSDSSVQAPPVRPSIERRLSTAMDNLKGTLRSTMRPETWNWIRYDRDDEVLSGFNQTFTKMWDKATNIRLAGQSETDSSTDDQYGPSKRRKRANTDDSDRIDWQNKYYHNAEINELHPPVVSRLPSTRDDAAWMLLPPPSAAVMAGKVRPQDEPAMRWPLARIGKTPAEWKELADRPSMQLRHAAVSSSTIDESIPDLSDSLTESSGSDKESLERAREKRHSAPVSGWDYVGSQSLDLGSLKNKRQIHEPSVQLDAAS